MPEASCPCVQAPQGPLAETPDAPQLLRMRADGRAVPLSGSALDEALSRAGLTRPQGGVQFGGTPAAGFHTPPPGAAYNPSGGSLQSSLSGTPRLAGAPLASSRSHSPACSGGSMSGGPGDAGLGPGKTLGTPAGSPFSHFSAALAAQAGLREAQMVAMPPHAPPSFRGAGDGPSAGAAAARSTGRAGHPSTGRGASAGPGVCTGGEARGGLAGGSIRGTPGPQQTLEARRTPAGRVPHQHSAHAPPLPPLRPTMPRHGLPPLCGQAQWAASQAQWPAAAPALLPAQLAARQGAGMPALVGAPYVTNAYGGVDEWTAQYQLAAAMSASAGHAGGAGGYPAVGGYAPGYPVAGYAEGPGPDGLGYGGPWGSNPQGPQEAGGGGWGG